LANQLSCALGLVEADVVENDDIAWRQFGSELSFDVAFEDGAIHRRVDDPRRDKAVAAQPGDEGLRLPFAEWRMRPEALALLRPAGAFGQLGVGRRLIDEDQPCQSLVEEALSPPDPHLTRLAHVGPLLLAGL
jgi:hypothetical protein